MAFIHSSTWLDLVCGWWVKVDERLGTSQSRSGEFQGECKYIGERGLSLSMIIELLFKKPREVSRCLAFVQCVAEIVPGWLNIEYKILFNVYLFVIM